MDTSNALVDTIEAVTVGQLIGLFAFILVVFGFFSKVVPIFKALTNFLEDWNGAPARSGVSERPGVMKRLETLEEQVKITAHEVKPNNGKSLADKVNKISEKVGVDDD